MTNIVTRRVYDSAIEGDGARILIDRIWPRGIKKSELKLDGWYKEIAPTKKLRKWFDHDAEKWEQFRKEYLHELKNKHNLARDLLNEQKHQKLILLYAAKDQDHNHARVLREYLQKLKPRTESD